MTGVDPAGLTPGAVARQLGVAVTTLRSWHQRYGLGPTGHSPNQHRRYTPADLARLGRMMQLTAAGLAPAEAARRALRPEPSTEPPSTTPVPAAVADSLARGLARTAVRMDAATLRTQLDQVLRDYGVVDAWEAVIAPVLIGIGTRHASSGALVEVEHLLTATVTGALSAVRPATPTSATGAPSPDSVLLACPGEEQHGLPLLALATALGAAGVPAATLGARVPPAALEAAIRRTGPAAVGVWSHHPATADLDLLAALGALPRGPRLVLALGPGWQVITEGQAVNAGIEGQVARVRTENGRILTARPSGDRQVELTL